MCTRAPLCTRRIGWGGSLSAFGWFKGGDGGPAILAVLLFKELVWKNYTGTVFSMALRGGDPSIPCFIYVGISVDFFMKEFVLRSM